MLSNILAPGNKRCISLLSRVWCGSQPQGPKYSEETLTNVLKSKLPKAETIEVKDISGGCGAMYEIYVQAEEFRGISIVKQHRIITEILKNEIKDMHGLRIHTETP